MKPRDARYEPELEALLTPRKIERQAPAEVHARAIARARAFVAGGRLPSARPSEPRLPAPPSTRTLTPLHFVLLASMAAAGGAIGTAITLHNQRTEPVPNQVPVPAQPSARAPEERPTTATSDAPPLFAPPLFAPPLFAPPLFAPPQVPTADPLRPSHGGAEGDPFAAELDLLSRAQAAYTRHDFSRALALVGEHSRRFPNGHLAEEREALRVRSLLGCGRHGEAERASAAFARRFTRSVLLPRAGESLSTR